MPITKSRYRMLLQSDETRAEELMQKARSDVKSRWDSYQQLAAMHYEPAGNGSNGQEKTNE